MKEDLPDTHDTHGAVLAAGSEKIRSLSSCAERPPLLCYRGIAPPLGRDMPRRLRLLVPVLLLLLALSPPASPREVRPKKGSSGTAPAPANPYLAIKKACPEEHAACTADGECAAEMADSFGPRKWSKPPSPLLETVVRCYRTHKQGGQQDKTRAGSAPPATSEDPSSWDPARVADAVVVERGEALPQDPSLRRGLKDFGAVGEAPSNCIFAVGQGGGNFRGLWSV